MPIGSRTKLSGSVPVGTIVKVDIKRGRIGCGGSDVISSVVASTATGVSFMPPKYFAPISQVILSLVVRVRE